MPASADHPRRRRLLAFAGVATLALLCAGCPSSGPAADDPTPRSFADASASESADHASCPGEPVHEARAPDVRPEHEQAEFWLARLPEAERDAALLADAERRELNERAAALPGGWRDVLDPAVADPEHVAGELDDRLGWLRGRVAAGKYVETQAGALERAAARVAAAVPVPAPNLHIVAEETPLYCVPSDEGLYREPIDPAFDRNRCASLHPGEVLRAILATPDGGWIYVDAGHSVGWIVRRSGSLGPATTAEALRERGDQAQVYLIADRPPLRAGTRLPRAPAPDGSPDDNVGDNLGDNPDAAGLAVWQPTAEGRERLNLDAAVARATPLSLTRRQLFTQAFAQLGQPYGWGGRDGHRDCSRYLYDLFAQFDIKLARNSGVQAQLGTQSIDVSELGEADKRQAIRDAASRGVVLLYMPGHIMLYLGHEGGRDYGISALSEYLVPCAGGDGDQIHKLDKVAVTTLEVGRGSERRAFIERITRMALFAPAQR